MAITDCSADGYVTWTNNKVTKALWDEVKPWNGGKGYSYDFAGSGKAADHPVYSINWYDMVKWCNARSQKEGLVPCYYNEAELTTIYKNQTWIVGTPYPKWNANGYRLPTEAEWEKAARGGARSFFRRSNTSRELATSKGHICFGAPTEGE